MACRAAKYHSRRDKEFLRSGGLQRCDRSSSARRRLLHECSAFCGAAHRSRMDPSADTSQCEYRNCSSCWNGEGDEGADAVRVDATARSIDLRLYVVAF